MQSVVYLCDAQLKPVPYVDDVVDVSRSTPDLCAHLGMPALLTLHQNQAFQPPSPTRAWPCFSVLGGGWRNVIPFLWNRTLHHPSNTNSWGTSRTRRLIVPGPCCVCRPRRHNLCRHIRDDVCPTQLCLEEARIAVEPACAVYCRAQLYSSYTTPRTNIQASRPDDVSACETSLPRLSSTVDHSSCI